MKKPLTIEDVKQTLSGVDSEIRGWLIFEVQRKYEHLVFTGCDPVAACYVCLDFLKCRIDCELNKL